MGLFDNFSRLKILSSVSVLSLLFTGALAPLATAIPSTAPAQVSPFGLTVGDTHTIQTNELCPAINNDFITLTNGDLVVNLSAAPNGATSLVIDSDAADECRLSLKSVTITDRGGSTVTDLTISTGAFSQNSDVSNALSSVSFLTELTNLNIGNGAFSQLSSAGSNGLVTVTFPETLTTLNIAKNAFKQHAYGDNALEAVSFPEGLTTLEIGESAFRQSSVQDSNTLRELTFPASLTTLNIRESAFSQSTTGNGTNGLATVTFPEGLTNLYIGPSAFWQQVSQGANALRAATFPDGLEELTISEVAFYTNNLADPVDNVPMDMVFLTAQAPGISSGSISLGENITNQLGQWFWYGEPTNTQTAWSQYLTAESKSYNFAEYRKFNLELRGGAFSDSSTNPIVYVYRSGYRDTNVGELVPSWGHQLGSTGVNSSLIGSFWLDLPTPIKDGYSFVGWTPTADDSSDDIYPPGYRLEVPESGLNTLYAVWAGAEVPGVPTGVTATPADGAATVTWGSPTPISGAPITSYTVEYKAANETTWTTKTVPATELTTTISGLTNGTKYQFRIAATNKIGTGAFTTPVTATPTAKATAKLIVSRVFGANRFLTSLDLNDNLMVEGAPVFVATGMSYPDALSAGPAVTSVKGSLVLTPKDSISKPMIDLIASKKPSIIYVIGGSGSVSDVVLNQLKAISKVERVSGLDRYKTSTAIFNKFFTGKTLDGAFIATGLSYPDALSAAAAGGALNRPVLLVNNGAGTSLDPGVATALKNQGVKTVQVIGGTSTVSNVIQKTLESTFKALTATELTWQSTTC